MGRPFGSKSKITKDIKERARFYGIDSIENIVWAMVKAKEDGNVTGVVMAAREILDRGYGKPQQTTVLEGNENNPIRIEAIETLLVKLAGIADRVDGGKLIEHDIPIQQELPAKPDM